MKSKASLILPKPNFFDGQKVTEADLDAEQMHQESISRGMINDFHGGGIVRESIFESNILLDTKYPGKYSPDDQQNLSKEIIEIGNYDGRPIYLDLQPSDSEYGNRLEIELVGSSVGGRISAKVLIVGFAYSSLDNRGILVSEVLKFEKNQILLTKYYYKEVLSVIFNNFSGGIGRNQYYIDLQSYNTILDSGYLLIKESDSLKVYPKSISLEQSESPNFDLNNFITYDSSLSIQDVLSEAVGDSVNFNDLYFELEPARQAIFEKNNSVIKSYGQKFLSKSNNLQKIDLLLSVSPDDSLEYDNRFDFSGEIVLSIHKLETETNCPTDLVPDRLIDYNVEIEPIMEISLSQDDLLNLGYKLNDIPQVVSFNFSTTLLANPNIDPSINKDEYYAFLISRRGDTRTGNVILEVGWDKPTRKEQNSQTLSAEEKFFKQSSRFFEYDVDLKKFVDYSEYSLWHKIYSDTLEVTPGTAYSSDSFLITIPKTEDYVGSAKISKYIDNISLSDISYGSPNYVVLSHMQEFGGTTVHPRTGNIAYTRIFDTGSVSVYNQADFDSLSESFPLILAKVFDKNVRDSSEISIDLSIPGTLDRDYILIIDPASELLNTNLVDMVLTPDLNCDCNKKYKIIKTECLSYNIADINNDGKIDSLDINEIIPYLGNTVNSINTERKILSSELDIIKFKQSDLNADGTVDGEDLSILEDAIDGYMNFSAPETFRVLKIYIQNIFEESDFPFVLDDPSILATTVENSNRLSFTVSDYRTALAIRVGDIINLSGTIDTGLFEITDKSLDETGLIVTLSVGDSIATIFSGESDIPFYIKSGTNTNIFSDNLRLLNLPYDTISMSIGFIEAPFKEENLEVCDLRRYVSRNFTEQKEKDPCICSDQICDTTSDCNPIIKNQQYISGDMYIPDGEIYSSPGVPYHGDFEYTTITVPLPPGSISDCNIDLYNTFLKSDGGSCKTAAGYAAMKYSDGTYVGCQDTAASNDIDKGRVKFSSSIASLYVDSLVSTSTLDGYVDGSSNQTSTTSAGNIVSESFIDQTILEFDSWTSDSISDSSIFTPLFLDNLYVSFSTLNVSDTARYGRYYPTLFNDLSDDFVIDFTMTRYEWSEYPTSGGVHSAFRLEVSNSDGTTAELLLGWKRTPFTTDKLFWSGVIKNSSSVVISTFEYLADVPDAVGQDVLFRIKRVGDAFFAYYINPSVSIEEVTTGEFIRIGSNPGVQPGSGLVSIGFESKVELYTTAGLEFRTGLKEIVLRDFYSSSLVSGSDFALARNVATNEFTRVAFSIPIEITPRSNIISASLTFVAASDFSVTDSFNIIPLIATNVRNLLPGFNYPYIQDTAPITTFMPGELSSGSSFTVDITNIIIKFISDSGFLPGYYKTMVIEPDASVSVDSSVNISNSIIMNIIYEEITSGIIFKVGVHIDPTTGIASFRTKNILFDSMNPENRTVIKFGVYLKKSGFKNKDIEIGSSELKKIGIGKCVDEDLLIDETELCYFIVSSTGVGTFVEGPFDCAFSLP